jgi:hypothetical protein
MEDEKSPVPMRRSDSDLPDVSVTTEARVLKYPAEKQRLMMLWQWCLYHPFPITSVTQLN